MQDLTGHGKFVDYLIIVILFIIVIILALIVLMDDVLKLRKRKRLIKFLKSLKKGLIVVLKSMGYWSGVVFACFILAIFYVGKMIYGMRSDNKIGDGEEMT